MCFRSSLNACRSSSLAKYFCALRPRRDRVHHAADQLLDAALALGRPDLAAEIFRDDDVGGLLRPGLRNLDVALLEHHLAAIVADRGSADFPLDLVERIDAGFGEEARKCQSNHRGRSGLRARLVGINRERRCGGSAALDALLGGTGGLVGNALFHICRLRSIQGGPWIGDDRHPPRKRPSMHVLEKPRPIGTRITFAHSRESGISSLVRCVSAGGSICAWSQGLSSE